MAAANLGARDVACNGTLTRRNMLKTAIALATGAVLAPVHTLSDALSPAEFCFYAEEIGFRPEVNPFGLAYQFYEPHRDPTEREWQAFNALRRRVDLNLVVEFCRHTGRVA